MTWAVKLIEKAGRHYIDNVSTKKRTWYWSFKEDDLVLAVLEKNKEIGEECADEVDGYEEGKRKPELPSYKQARAFRELVQAMEKVKTK